VAARGCVRRKQKQKQTVRPPNYRVLLHNDSLNKREYVVQVLLKARVVLPCARFLGSARDNDSAAAPRRAVRAAPRTPRAPPRALLRRPLVRRRYLDAPYARHVPRATASR
jgi:hypothetical protein